jgi:hypothetical protein
MSVSSDDSDATITQPSKQSLFPSTVGEWRELNSQYCSPFTRGRHALSTYVSFRHSDGSSTELRFKGGFQNEPESGDDGYYLSICPVIENPETETDTVLVNAFVPTVSFPGDTPEEELVHVMGTMAQHYKRIVGDPDACPEITSALLNAIENPANLDDFVAKGLGKCDEDDARKERCGTEWIAYDAPEDAATPHIAEGDAKENA